MLDIHDGMHSTRPDLRNKFFIASILDLSLTAKSSRPIAWIKTSARRKTTCHILSALK